MMEQALIDDDELTHGLGFKSVCIQGKRHNLTKLVGFMKANYNCLPHRFEMTIDHGDGFGNEVFFADKHESVRVGNLFSFGPAAGVEPLKSETWKSYINRCFTLGNSDLEDWLCSWMWYDVDNSIDGLSARLWYIRLIRNNGTFFIPSRCFERIVSGDEEYMQWYNNRVRVLA